MVKVKVEYYGIFRDLVGDLKEETIDIPSKNGVKLKDLIDYLAQIHDSKIKEYISEGFGEDLKALILVNGSYANLESEIRDGDVVSILPPASGG